MSTLHVIRQLEEKNVPIEIDRMVWSDRMDLVAFSNVKGEVALHRLSWTRAWSLSPPSEGLTVKAIAWRPDGKILAIGYDSGQVVLVSVENKKTLLIKRTNGEINCLVWLQEKLESKPRDVLGAGDDDEKHDYMKYIDLSRLYIKDPTPTSPIDASTSDDPREPNLLADQAAFNILLVGTKDGYVHVRIFGCFTCASLNIRQYLNQICSVEHIHLSEDLSRMVVSVKGLDERIKVVHVDSSVLMTHTQELFALATKYVKLIDLITYLTNTITNITETWESFLLEIDHKLSNYAKKVPEGGVSSDFLDLLVFGLCSPELEEFLMTELTKKGLEKFGQTIEMSYANIQKLLLKNVSKFGQNFTYHLAELRGMARLEFRYKILGLFEEKISKAIRSSGAFLIKAGEMQQIINHSVINYKAFFRWLYGAILNLMGESIPSEIHKMTQQDLAYITEFLQNFDHIGVKTSGHSAKGFKMERVGQYLTDEPLTIASDMQGNDWTSFLAENECLRDHPSVLKHYRDKSLIQQFKELAGDVTAIFDVPKEVLQDVFAPLRVMEGFETVGPIVRFSSTNVADKMLFTLLWPARELYFFEVELDGRSKGAKLKFAAEPENYAVLDAAFYSPTTLSLLLREPTPARDALLLQFGLAAVLESLEDLSWGPTVFPRLNGSMSQQRTWRCVEMASSRLAVSGSRRVSVVLAENGKKVKLFEMEAEEEDEDGSEAANGSFVREENVADE